MLYRNLGKTGLSVSSIGFGAWGIGGEAYGPVDDSASKDALRFAYENGVTFFDTADVYGDGHSESVIGDALKDVRKRIILATKVGTFPHYGFDMPQDFSPNYIRGAVEQSLRRLQTDFIDLYQLHSPPGEFIRDTERAVETMSMMQALKAEGKIRLVGISVRSPEDGLFVARTFNVDVIQVNFNLIDQRAVENGLLSFCEDAGIGVIARTPLAFGFISGRYSPGVKFHSPDHRANWPQEQIDRWAEAPRLFSEFVSKERTIVQFALQFCLSNNAVSTVIPGMLSREEVSENIGAASIPPLTEKEISSIQAIYQNHVFYDPKAKQNSAPKDGNIR